MKPACWKCMKRKVPNVGDECGTCKYLEWRKAEHQLFKSSRQTGKATTEGVHERWRAPNWMLNRAEQGWSLKELSWGWELRGANGEKPQHDGA